MRFEIFSKTKPTSFPVQPISWYRSLTHHYFFIQTCLALEKSGFFDMLATSKELSTEELAVLLGVDESLLKTCVEFLWATTDLLEKNGGKFALKEQRFSKSLWVLEAYKPVFDNLAELLKKEKQYGRDIVRDGFYLQKASDLFSGDAIEKVLGILKREKDGVLIDFGCGSGKALIFYCKENLKRYGVGIDIDSSIVQEADGHIKDAGLDNAISVIESDVLDIEKWQGVIPENVPIFFLASTMLHEFLRNGEGFVVNFLEKVKSAFPDSRFFIIEFDALPFEKIKEETDMNRKLFAAMYELWHPLTNQGMPQSQEVWERIIKAGGWKIQNVVRAKNDLIIYDCLL